MVGANLKFSSVGVFVSSIVKWAAHTTQTNFFELQT